MEKAEIPLQIIYKNTETMSNVVYWQNRQCIVIQIYCAAKFAKRGDWERKRNAGQLVFFWFKRQKAALKKIKL